MEWEAQLAEERSREAARTAAVAAEAAQPTVRDVVEQFMAKHMAGKKSAPSIRYRLDRLAAILGNQKIRDVTRQNVIQALERIAEGHRQERETVSGRDIDPGQATVAVRRDAGMGGGFLHRDTDPQGHRREAGETRCRPAPG
ncbi:MAG: hypothetical protein A2V78_16795 [Betaproteobacteria bacterium RBG_16_64_18]|nr:MAG: hypothetical protein A2V78_16795 [Betaproteobacteria bacterium RBG_16_64_18]OGA16568.1 MAG: hypothetical protein A3H33_03780 [Betaproteobacteria bacterium RIFCSPLOWO2_02_FULL_65_20]